jgi:hypothetical protein
VGDALDDCQAEANACVVGAYAFATAKKRLGKRGNYLWGERLARVLDGEHRTFGVNAGRDPHGPFFGQAVDERVMDEVRAQLLPSANNMPRFGAAVEKLCALRWSPFVVAFRAAVRPWCDLGLRSLGVVLKMCLAA